MAHIIRDIIKPMHINQFMIIVVIAAIVEGVRTFIWLVHPRLERASAPAWPTIVKGRLKKEIASQLGLNKGMLLTYSKCRIFNFFLIHLKKNKRNYQLI